MACVLCQMSTLFGLSVEFCTFYCFVCVVYKTRNFLVISDRSLSADENFFITIFSFNLQSTTIIFSFLSLVSK